MSKDRHERRHRRTHRHPEATALMAGADFGRVPSLAEAMGLEAPADARHDTQDKDVGKGPEGDNPPW